MKGPKVTQTNGHYESQGPRRGILVLADPAETGRRVRRCRDDRAVCSARRPWATGTPEGDAQECTANR